MHWRSSLAVGTLPAQLRGHRAFGRHAGDPSDRVKNNRNIPFPSDRRQLCSSVFAVGFPLGRQARLGKVISGGSAADKVLPAGADGSSGNILTRASDELFGTSLGAGESESFRKTISLGRFLSVSFASGAVLQSRCQTCIQSDSQFVSHPYHCERSDQEEHRTFSPKPADWSDSDGEEISEEKPGPMDDTQHRVAFGPSVLNHGVRGEHPSPPQLLLKPASRTRIPFPS